MINENKQNSKKSDILLIDTNRKIRLSVHHNVYLKERYIMKGKTWKRIGVILAFIAIVGLIIYCFILTQAMNKQTALIGDQNKRLILAQLDNRRYIDEGFETQYCISGEFTFSSLFTDKELNFYVVEYKDDKKINEHLVAKQEFIDQSRIYTNHRKNENDYVNTNYYIFKILTNKKTNQIQYYTALGSENDVYWQSTVPSKILSTDYINIANSSPSGDASIVYGSLGLGENDSIVQHTFGEYKVVFYVLPE